MKQERLDSASSAGLWAFDWFEVAFLQLCTTSTTDGDTMHSYNSLEYRLAHALGQQEGVPDSVWTEFLRAGTFMEIPKETTIKQPHQRELYLTFVVEGSGAIVLWRGSQWVCVDLCYENDFLCDYMSLLTSTESALEVRTMEASTLFRISYDMFQTLRSSPMGTAICLRAAEALFSHKQQQQIDLLTLTAAERYRSMMEHQPDILLRTPQRYVASYLGITAQSLSRIRAEGGR
jgi:CRP-like cAMP-binding protein